MRKHMFVLLISILALSAIGQPSLRDSPIRIKQPPSGVFMEWYNGYPKDFALTNLTTGQFYLGIPWNAFMFPAAMGTTNTFIVGNTNGVSNTLTAVATNQTLNSSIAIYSYIVTVQVRSNVWSDIWTSTNLLTWKRIASIVSTNSQYQFLWTNDFGSRYFRSSAQ